MYRTLLTLVFSFFILTSCRQKSCSFIPETFNTYKEAHAVLANTKFQLEERISTPKSSWIRGATYLSCDGKTGFMILDTDQTGYIHKGVPVSVWKEFKKASSHGRYYSKNIKHRYQLKLRI